MKKYHLYLLGMLVLPWLSLPLLGKKHFRRNFPSALFICLFVVGESVLAKKKVWWWFFKKLNRKIPGETSLIWGPFFIGTLWILKLTRKRIIGYFLTNLSVDSFFVYVVLNFFKKIGFASLIKLKKYQLLILFTFKSVILYLFHYHFIEKLSMKKEQKAPTTTA